MQITQLEPELLVPSVGGPSRSPGLHVTDVIRSIGEQIGVMKSKASLAPHIANNTGFSEGGFVWESLLESAFGERMAHRIGEVLVDGIAGSPDGVDFSADPWVLEEYKCTWRSHKCPSTNWYWMTQIQCYLYMVRHHFKYDRPMTTAVMRVLWLCGNYKPPFPMYCKYRVEFTPEEIDKTWAMLVSHAKTMSGLPQ